MTIEFLAMNLGNELKLLNQLKEPMTTFEKERHNKQSEFVEVLELSLLKILKEKHNKE